MEIFKYLYDSSERTQYTKIFGPKCFEEDS